MVEREITATYRQSPDGLSVVYGPARRQDIVPYTRRPPRSRAHQLSRDIVDATRALIALTVFLGVLYCVTWIVAQIFHTIPLYTFLAVFALVGIVWVFSDD